MKKMVKVILVCTAVLCAIDQIMRFTGPYAIEEVIKEYKDMSS